MKKNLTPILLLAGAGALAYFFLKGGKSATSQRMLDEGEQTGEGEGAKAIYTKQNETTPDGQEIDATIDTTKTGQSVQSAIQQAKELASGIKDIAVLIKTKRGKANVLYTKGRKKRRKRRTIIPKQYTRTRKKRFGIFNV